MLFLKKISRGISLGLALLTLTDYALKKFSNSKVISLITSFSSYKISQNDKIALECMRPIFTIRPPFDNITKIIFMKVTGYHSEHCTNNDFLRGRTASWASACNTHGVASDTSLLPLGTVLYINDDRLDPKEKLRVVDDGCETCVENGEKGIYHIDVRFLEYKERKPKNDGLVHSSTSYDGKDRIPVEILRWGKDKSTKIIPRLYR